MYTFSSCRQAHQHRQLQVNLFFSLLELLSTPSPLQPRTGPCRTVRRPQVRGERLPQAVGGSGDSGERSGQALPCPGARERERERWDPARGESGTMEARGTAEEGRGRLLLRRGGRWGGGGGGSDLLCALPVLLCSRACSWSGTGGRGRGGSLGRGWGRGWGRSGGRTGALGVVHVLSSRPGVRLPVRVVVLFGGRAWRKISTSYKKCTQMKT